MAKKTYSFLGESQDDPLKRSDITPKKLPAQGFSSLNRTTLGAFLLMVIVGGSNAVAVRFSNLGLPPFWGAGTRFALAGLIFWVIVLARRIPLPKGRALVGALLYGALSFGASYAFIYWALLYLQAGLFTVVVTLVPLITFLLAWAHGLEPFRWRGLVGALIALAGILIGVGNELGASVPLLPLLATVVGVACSAEASVLYKLFPKGEPLATNALAMSVGALMLLVLSFIGRETWALPTSPPTWIAFVYLVLLGSVVLFYLYLFVLDRWTASATSYSFLLFPVMTVIVAAWLLGEVVTPAFVLGSILVLLGVWIGAIAQPKAKG